MASKIRLSVRGYVISWLVATAAACAFIYAESTLRLAAAPDAATSGWAYAALEASRLGQPVPQPPAAAQRYRAAGPTFVTVHVAGARKARHVADGPFAQVILDAAKQFAQEPALAGASGPVSFRVAITRGSGRLMAAAPGLSLFSLAPLRDGVAASFAGRHAYATPDDLLERGATDRAVAAPVPDLTFGTDLIAVEQGLAEELDTTLPELRRSGELRRLRIDPVFLPRPKLAPNPATLRAAARAGVEFVLRHQETSGRFTYIYDAQRDEAVEVRAYSLARHAGTIFFLARAAQQLGMPEARAGALRALGFLRETALATCGARDRICIVQNDRVEMGGSALAALACAEILRGGDDRFARKLLRGSLEFIRAQQRPDGELMHEYDREHERPIDVQRMYYSGEAALALLTGYEQLHDPRDLEAASRLMSHLTGAGWGFFGARYYYGEEHWTCQAVAKAAAHMPVDAALDFCLRWANWQERLQYRAGQTPWQVEGAFGVGPVLLPRVTTAASRVEALVPVYRLAKSRGWDVRMLHGVIERSLGLLLRMQWTPGPAHLFAQPDAAVGGIPSTDADLRSRVDMVQHAGSAMLAWSDLLTETP